MSGSGASGPVTTPPAGRLRRATERFNQRALRLTRPGSHWILASLKLGLLMFTVTCAVATPVVLLLMALGIKPPTGSNADEHTILYQWITGVGFAPITETAMIMLIHRMTRSLLGITSFVFCSTTVFGVLHIWSQGVPIGGVISFLLMSYQYVSFSSTLGVGWAYLGVAVSHAVNNSLAVLLLTLAGLILEANN